MDTFSHEVLGEVSDETRWLRFLTTRDLIRLASAALACILMLNILPKNALFLSMCIRVLLGIVEKPKGKYMTGGGVPYFDLAVRRAQFAKACRLYALGAEGEGGNGHG